LGKCATLFYGCSPPLVKTSEPVQYSHPIAGQHQQSLFLAPTFQLRRLLGAVPFATVPSLKSLFLRGQTFWQVNQIIGPVVLWYIRALAYAAVCKSRYHKSRCCASATTAFFRERIVWPIVSILPCYVTAMGFPAGNTMRRYWGHGVSW
jgi:hypothetical protein